MPAPRRAVIGAVPILIAGLSAGCPGREAPPAAAPIEATPTDLAPAPASSSLPDALAEMLTGGEVTLEATFAQPLDEDQWSQARGTWTVQDGVLIPDGAAATLWWLQRLQPLPARGRIELDVRLDGEADRPQLHLWAGDVTPAPELAGYQLLRRGADGQDRLGFRDLGPAQSTARPARPVPTDGRERWTIVRTERAVHWLIDGELHLSRHDPAELEFPHFGPLLGLGGGAGFDALGIYAFPLPGLPPDEPDEPAPPSDAELRALARDEAARAAGEATFVDHCAACHLVDAGGRIGPSLRDATWIHGGAPAEIFRTITRGVPAKGCPPWGPILEREARMQLTAWLLSLQPPSPP